MHFILHLNAPVQFHFEGNFLSSAPVSYNLHICFCWLVFCFCGSLVPRYLSSFWKNCKDCSVRSELDSARSPCLQEAQAYNILGVVTVIQTNLCSSFFQSSVQEHTVWLLFSKQAFSDVFRKSSREIFIFIFIYFFSNKSMRTSLRLYQLVCLTKCWVSTQFGYFGSFFYVMS